MKIQISWSKYNQRRYSKPWICKITYWTPSKQERDWGSFIGDEDNGGLLVLSDCDEGDIVCFGQKDNRGTSTRSEYAIVDAEGNLTTTTKVKAFKAWEKGDKNIERSEETNALSYQDIDKIIHEEMQVTISNIKSRVRDLLGI